jgi:oxygen-dependent protoporphyrinogen oxidase
MREQATAAVIGAGMAGLAAAYDLQRAGYRTTVFESRDRVGGRIWTIRKGEFLMDLGAAFYLGTYKATIAMIHELGLSESFESRPAMGAVRRDGTTHWLDYTTPLRTGLGTKLISNRTKLTALKLAKLAAKHRNDLGYDSYETLAALDTETVREYCRRELNEEFLQYCGRPLVSGAWVADDEETSLALMVWTARNLLVPNVYNLGGGVAQLPVELANRLDVRLSRPVVNVADTGAGVEITHQAPAGGAQTTEPFDTCVIAATARPALAMFPQMDANTRGFYEMVTYRRLGSVAIWLSRRPQGDREIYTLGVPGEDPDVIAVMADHNKAEGRAPEGKGLLTVLLTHEYLNAHEHLTDDQVTEYAIERASAYYGDIGGDVEETACVRWHESVPVMQRGRFRRMAEYHRNLNRDARVQFAGDFDRIPGLNGALMSGRDAAVRIISARPPHHRPSVSRGSTSMPESAMRPGT